jgi:hypothetical protein
MDQHDELNRALLVQLLDRALVDFEEALRNEAPGLSKKEIERYMRAARKFASHLIGSKPRTRGRQSRGGSAARSK